MEDLNLYLKDVLTERPHTRVPSADTVLRGYKGFDGYSPSVFTIGGLIAYLENREGIENRVAQVRANAVLIQSHNGVLSIAGVADGTDIAVYSTSGQMVGSAKARGTTSTIATSLRIGNVAIIRIGNVAIIRIGDKSIKVVMQ